jgi:hypothetical protein
VEAVDPAPRGSDQEIDSAVAVDVADADGVEAERLAGDPARIGLEQRAVLSRVQIRAAAGSRHRGVLPRAHDQVVVTIMIDVPGVGRADAESLARRLTGQRQDPAPVLPRVDVDPAGRRPFRGVGEIRRIDVRDPVAVGIADHRHEHGAECRARVVRVDGEGSLL